MALHALIYRYTDDADLVARHRPEHREYLRGLAETGELVIAGPLETPDSAGGLLVLDVDSSERAEQIAHRDPFHSNGVLVDYRVHAWTLSIGADRLSTGRQAPPATS